MNFNAGNPDLDELVFGVTKNVVNLNRNRRLELFNE